MTRKMGHLFALTHKTVLMFVFAFLWIPPLPAHAVAPAPHIVFLIANDPHNYEAHATIPPFAEMLEAKHGYRVTVLLREGEGAAHRFSGLDALEEAELLVVFIRRTALPIGQLEQIQAHLAKGRPLIGIRTANHAFSVREVSEGSIPAGYADWWEFVPDVLGCENRGYGPVEPGTAVAITEGARGHPILEGIDGPWHSDGNVYRVAPLVDEAATVLLTGRVEEAVEPIAWTRTTAHGGRVFYTSLGHPKDFEGPQLPKLLFNAIQWAVGAVVESQS